ncbi:MULTISPECIES: 4-phosphoerythronate dehydrogenase PdxB [unclassified Pseudomonas]|uniref:4-phosphoerythronate dehydrogenase PdxB n=1 Tax=unclassified Pseudomonas TaxID=196821 RepID=UPI00244A3D8C|nr:MULTISPECIES: 4-phosphoerythronate dehydrogenase PdxB [unclassified Pseudomonas]MDG9929609.1 4-phosphoerythronate dehydrogenase PdxB [Pseudomonas sp. GD04042]MDH0483384.1 4-phosphoerythronate dehydrogenase PdxB [Pseudomonas sp. GD04015]MDH0604813.1 4-phosphoerythronate dehydrogenase PdxB [Pseudomonas sp. GD03869]
MQIVADENIPLLDEFFSAFGPIARHPGRGIDRAALCDAEVLLVRSVTRVDRTLLEGSRVRFVGTCTIGTDHLDLDYFAEAGIAWSSAPGCNARGVVDYVLGCLLALAETTGRPLAGLRYGVLGAGQVGGRLVQVLRGLGWPVLVCDPPRQAAEGGDFVDLATILRECDVISLHTPLDAGTRHLLGAEQLHALRPGAWLINASRGPVVDNAALKAHLRAGADLQVALDVWEGEPLADPELAALCRIATPHIAGYSLDGKLRGTAQIYRAYCAAMGLEERVRLADLLPPAWLEAMALHTGASSEWALASLCRAVYDPRRDDADFRRSLVGDAAQRKAAFDALRKHYPYRREIDGLRVRLDGEAPRLAELVRALGCELS